MDNETIGTLLLTLIGCLSFFGMGSILISILYDPDESSIKQKIIDSETWLQEDDQEPAEVVLEENPTFEFEQLKES
jgi:hypothetical protein